MLFGCYRRTDAADPDVYVAAVAAVLGCYGTDLIREVTDPRTGIMTSEKHLAFMPNAGELKVYCDGVAARRERLNHLGSLPTVDFTRARLAPPEPKPGDKATVFVPEGHERYAKLVDWTKTGDVRKWSFGKSSDGRNGIWIAWDIWDDRPSPMRSVGGVAAAVTLSAAARKTMADVDAERFGETPADQREAAE